VYCNDVSKFHRAQTIILYAYDICALEYDLIHVIEIQLYIRVHTHTHTHTYEIGYAFNSKNITVLNVYHNITMRLDIPISGVISNHVLTVVFFIHCWVSLPLLERGNFHNHLRARTTALFSPLPPGKTAVSHA